MRHIFLMFAILFANACALTADHAAVDTAAPEQPDTGESDTAVATDTDSPTETGDSDTASTPSDTGCDTTERRLRDRDGDGYGDPESYEEVSVCDPWEDGFVNWIEGRDDCDDTNADIHPNAVEICDDANADENCNGVSDDEDRTVDRSTTGTVWYMDYDGDGYGEDYTTQLVCDTAAGWSLVGGDCNDGVASINPGTIEVCDGGNVDENCNGLVNDADPSEIPPYQVFKDADGDGYGNVDVTMMVCESPDASWIGDSTDCNDADPAVYPGHGC